MILLHPLDPMNLHLNHKADLGKVGLKIITSQCCRSPIFKTSVFVQEDACISRKRLNTNIELLYGIAFRVFLLHRLAYLEGQRPQSVLLYYLS